MKSISNCMSIVNDLSDQDSQTILERLEEYQKQGIPAGRAQVMAVTDVLAEAKADREELMGMIKEQHPDAFSEMKASTDRRTATRTPTREQVEDDRVGISHVLMALGAKEWLYESPVSNAKTIAQIAKDKGVTKVREDDIGGGVKEWKITLPDTVDTDTGKSKPGRSAYLRQKGNELWIDAEITGEGAGGSKIYDIGFNYAHNNGLVFIGDRNGFSKVAQIRRLENMISAAIKYGSTDFMAPHANQLLGSGTVPALRWEKGDTLGNLRRMIDVSQAAMQNKQPVLAAVQYDQPDNNFKDSEGNPLGYDDLHYLARAVRPADGSGGAGVTTIQRAALYRSLLQSKGARLAFLDSIRGIPGTGGQGFGGALEGSHYSTDRKSLPFKDATKRIPELAAAAKQVADGTMTAAEYDSLVNLYKPISPYEDVPEPASTAEITDALKSDQKPRINKGDDIPEGKLVALRLDIPAYTSKGVWVVSIHDQKTPTTKGVGSSLAYGSTAIVEDAHLSFSQPAGLKIAAGDAKAPLAAINGNWVKATAAEAKKQADAAIEDDAWVQVGMDPERHGYFYDRETTQPVVKASKVIQVGPLVLAKDPVYGDKKDFKYSTERTPWSQRQDDKAPDAFGREVSLTQWYNQLADVYDEANSAEEAYDMAYEASNAQQKSILRQLKNSDFLGFDYPHQAIRAILEEPDAFDLPATLKAAVSRMGNQRFKYSTERNPQVDTPEFKRWFGDSKVVDESGEPIRLYTGTSKDIDFSKFKIPKNGAWFTTDAASASQYAVENDSMRIETKDYRTFTHVNTASRVMPVYVNISNPYTPTPEDMQAMRYATNYKSAQGKIFEKAKAAGHDGINMGDGVWVVIKSPTQIKSAIGNGGSFDDANPDIRASTARERWSDAVSNVATANMKSDFLSNVRDSVVSPFMANTSTELSVWQKTIGTPFHKAMMNKGYKRVFDGVQKFIEDVSLFGTRAEQAGAVDGRDPLMFPSIDLTWDTINPLSKKNRGLSSTENANVGKILAAGTLHEGMNPETGMVWTDDELLDTKKKKDGTVSQNPKTKQPWTADEIREARRANPHYGRVFTDDELRSEFNATDREIQAYKESRAAIEQSLSDYAKSEMGQLVRTMTSGMKDEVKARVAAMVNTVVRGENTLIEAKAQLLDIVDVLEKAGAKADDVRTRINGISGDVGKLKEAGYSPLMRFGTWAVQGVDANGEQVFFALAQNKAEAARLQKALEADPAINNVFVGELNTEALKVFRGMTPETAQLFAEHNGMDKAEGTKAYLRDVISSRSVMQRMQKRKGVEGYSHDATRTVASFITGNSRRASSNLHMADLSQAVLADDLKGSYQRDADNLVEYVKNPQEEAQAMRTFLFANYLGGSIASGLVNLTQPVMMTFPYLSQFGVARAGGALSKAVREAGSFLRSKKVADADLQTALEAAKADGILDPNEIFQLMGAAQRGVGSYGMQKFLRVWGMNFQLTEAFNRTTTFIAAYRTATETLKDADGQAQLQKAMNTTEPVTAAEFAAHAIRETQGVYNKGNRPNWARGALGATVFTFKQYSISYMEFLKRAWGDGLIPKKQFMVATGTLFLAAGVNGLPGADDLDDIIDSAGHLMGYNTNSKKWKRDALQSVFGKDFAEALQDGISHYLPFDIAGRVGMGNFLPGTRMLDPAQTASQKLQSVMEVGGVAGSTISNYINALGSIAKGDARAAALVALPVAVQNAYKGIEMGVTGVAYDMGGRKIRDVDGVDALSKAIGLQPRSLAEDGGDNRIAQIDIGTQRWKQQAINAEYARAIFSNDKDKLAEVRKEIADWNKNNPSSKIQPNMEAIMDQVKKMRMTRDQRTVQSAPKSIRADVRETVAGV